MPPAIGLLAPELRARLKLVQQVRPEDLERVRAAYAGMGVAAELARKDDENLRPEINRATQENYAPGSIFKPVVALAALKALAARPTRLAPLLIVVAPV